MAKLNKQQFAVMLLDFSKAYDRVSIPGLIIKLHEAGISPAIVLLINDWLTGRSNRVMHNGYSSQVFTPQNGIIQGSPLSVCLWLLYIDKIDVETEDLIFMDDTALVVSAPNNKSLEEQMEARRVAH